MKLTPLDIHHKEFRHSLRGYAEDEVDQFLDEVADEFERLFKENIDLSEKIEQANQQVRSYQEMERTLHNTMLAAQQSAEDIVAKAQKEADLMLRDAELKAKEIVHAALAEKQRTQSEFARIKQAEDDFRQKFRFVLENYLNGIAEVPVPAEMAAMVAEPVEEYQPAVTRPYEEVTQPEPVAAAPEAPAEPQAAVGEASSAVPVVEQAAIPLEGEPAAPGIVTSIHLGETAGESGAPEQPVSFGEPLEFKMPGFGAGERDEDIDIEEID
jgi:cell division initiation protein